MIPNECFQVEREYNGLVIYAPIRAFEVDGVWYRPEDLFLGPMFDLKNDHECGAACPSHWEEDR